MDPPGTVLNIIMPLTLVTDIPVSCDLPSVDKVV